MEYKILTKNSVDNTNIDGARAENFNAGMRDGIVKGALNEGTFASQTSNGIYLDTCELRISGHRIVIDEPFEKTFVSTTTSNARYALVAQIIVDDNSNVDFSIFHQDATTPLIKNNLFKTVNGAGTYQLEIGRFTLKTDGTVDDVQRTVDVITGGASGSQWDIEIGNVVTEKISTNLEAEVDIDKRYDQQTNKEYLDFNFSLPVDVDEAVDQRIANAEQVANDAHDLAVVAEATAGDAISVASDASTVADAAQAKVEALYPVGAIYLSISDTSPASFFGGSWEKIENKFLLGASSDYPIESTGGEATHTLTLTEMPTHKHGFDYNNAYRKIETGWSGQAGDWSHLYYFNLWTGFYPSNSDVRAVFYDFMEYAEKYAGGSQAHNNMPPYIAINIWKRVS